MQRFRLINIPHLIFIGTIYRQRFADWFTSTFYKIFSNWYPNINLESRQFAKHNKRKWLLKTCLLWPLKALILWGQCAFYWDLGLWSWPFYNYIIVHIFHANTMGESLFLFSSVYLFQQSVIFVDLIIIYSRWHCMVLLRLHLLIFRGLTEFFDKLQ